MLIVLYLFISALLCKQFYSGQLYNLDGSPSRYNFGTTGDALVSVFIILTGENWNEIMIQVIQKEDSFSPAPLFIMLMVLGNFMLLNLFLAILLKSISDISNETSDEAGTKEEEAAVADDGNNESVMAKSEKTNKIDGDQSLHSSNSDIEQEFKNIRDQLIKLSGGLALVKKEKENEDEKDEYELQLQEVQDHSHHDHS